MALTSQRALSYVKDAVRVAFEVNQSYGDQELSKVTSRAADIQTKRDIVVGKAVLGHAIKTFGNNAVIYDEEGLDERRVTGAEKLSVVFDDIDGTDNASVGRRDFPYTTGVAVFDKPNPRLSDALAAAIVNHSTGNVYYAARGAGVYFSKGSTEVRVKNSGLKHLKGDGKRLARGTIDTYMTGNLVPEIAELQYTTWNRDMSSTVLNMAAVASGALDFIITGDNCPNPNKRRTGEEIAATWLLVKEGGGVVRSWDGKDLSDEPVGWNKGRTWNFVAAATPELADEVTVYLMSKPRVKEFIARGRPPAVVKNSARYRNLPEQTS